MKRVLSALIPLGALFGSAEARAGDATVRGSSEVSGYQDSVAVSVLTPTVAVAAEDPTVGYSVNGRYLVDIVTAASPDIVATASPRWNEVRNAGNLGFKYKPGTTGFSVNAATSHTPDYFSLSASATLLQEVDEKNWSLSLGYGFGHDIISRTGTPNSVFSRTFDTHSITASASRILNSSSVLTFTADVMVERGDQSKPYRYIPMFSAADAATIAAGASPTEVARHRIQARPLEQLPLARERYALTARYAVRGDAGTLRVEERVYTDTWALFASTTDLRYYFDADERLMVWPHVRAHVQSAVNFWQRAYVAGSAADLPAFRTGDRELGALLTAGGGGGVRWGIGPRGDVYRYALQLTADGYCTQFFDALYVKYRMSGLTALSMEATF
ncbi:MAG: DUF3570 domain-containing protein [Polyangiaceae bacterium]